MKAAKETSVKSVLFSLYAVIAICGLQLGISIFKFHWLTAGSMIIVMVVAALLMLRLRQWNKQLGLAMAALSNLDEKTDAWQHVSRIRASWNDAVEFINALQEGHEPKAMTNLSLKNGLGEHLYSLKTKLDRYKDEEHKLSWLQGGIAEFNTLLRTGSSIDEFADIVITRIVRYLNANQGAMFIEYENESEGRYLRLASCYAYDRKKFLDKKIFPGEGMLGECMLSKSMVYLADIPRDYVQITSGLGQATPRNVVIVPLNFKQKIYGAIELASFTKLEKHQIEFLSRISENIAAEIATRLTVANTEKLLQESHNLAHELQAQDEELKQNMEQLTATQEEMARKKAELDSVFSAINNTVASVEFDMEGKVINANSIFLSVTGYTMTTLESRTFALLLPDRERDKPQHQMMWENLRNGKFFSGEFKFIHRNGEELWLSGTLNPVFNAKGEPYKVIMIAQFTTQEKAKQLELAATVAALKKSFPYVELDKSFSCKSANDIFLSMFDIRKIALKTTPFSSLLAPESKLVLNMLLSDHGSRDYFEAALQFNQRGSVAQYRTTFSVIRNMQGEVSRILVLMADAPLNILAVA